MGFLDQIKMVALPDAQFIKEETPKSMIVLHHTASSASPYGVIEYWATTPERVATHFVIAGAPPPNVTAWYDGQIYQTYSSKYWGWHLGLKEARLPVGSKDSTFLNSHSIGIEICNWGPLEKVGEGRYKSWSGAFVP